MAGKQDNAQLLRILAVDDSRLMRKSVARILKGLNDVIVAENGEQAWQLLQKDDTIKIVCCDLSMPVMDGFGFLKLVRDSDDERIRNTPVIIITGQEDSEENRNKIFEAGASDFVSKPFDSAQLRASIQTHTRLEKTAKALMEKTSEFEIAAAVDPLTGLGTAAFFHKSASQAISYARRNEKELVIMQLEIDGFRDLFMKIGKETSSALIKKVGEILSKHTRQEDMLCRIGIDGFAALLRTNDLAGAVRMTERAREMIANINMHHGVEKQVATVSVGVARVEVNEATTTEDLLQASNVFLSKAQHAGGNQVSYDKSMVDRPVATDLTLEQSLYLISKGQADKVAGQIDGIIQRILPLLGLYAKVNAKGVRLLIEKLSAVIK